MVVYMPNCKLPKTFDFQVTCIDRQTEGDSQDPTVHEHKWAQKFMFLYMFFYLKMDGPPPHPQRIRLKKKIVKF